MLEFERDELNRERLRELIVAECQHYKDLRNSSSQEQEVSITDPAASETQENEAAAGQ